jgi:hypothetical protein
VSPTAPPGDVTLELAARVAQVLEQEGAPAVIIGAMAMAAHHYARATEDLDLAVAVEPLQMRRLAKTLSALGVEVTLREPDPQDPLGGVIDVHGAGADRIQVVNFDNSPAGGFPRLVREALTSSSPLEPGSNLRVADLFSLIGFKLYAGGDKSWGDIRALLRRNAPVDLVALRAWCKERRLARQLESVLSGMSAP